MGSSNCYMNVLSCQYFSSIRHEVIMQINHKMYKRIDRIGYEKREPLSLSGTNNSDNKSYKLGILKVSWTLYMIASFNSEPFEE
jgi:hypothetical protein